MVASTVAWRPDRASQTCIEAAAATAVVMATGAGRPEPAEPFVADHPFLFFIVDSASGLVLFMGRVVDLPRRERKAAGVEGGVIVSATGEHHVHARTLARRPVVRHR